MLEKVIENWTSRLDYIRASRGSPMPEIIFKIISLKCNSETTGKDINASRNIEPRYRSHKKRRDQHLLCDIITLLEQLHNKRKSCILQWIPAHVNIEGNECSDSLAKEARGIKHKCTTITLDDANAVAKHRIMNHTFKKPLVTEFDCSRIITSTIARLRTEHLKGMKIHPDKDKIICSMQTLSRSPTDAQSHLGMPNRRNKVTKNGNGPSEGLFAGTPVQP
ncbi:RNase H domain-containing protein [Trichonephila clavipes]|nr:RNase H domain-containing protein [Trichonephila clavipes]